MSSVCLTICSFLLLLRGDIAKTDTAATKDGCLWETKDYPEVFHGKNGGLTSLPAFQHKSGDPRVCKSVYIQHCFYILASTLRLPSAPPFLLHFLPFVAVAWWVHHSSQRSTSGGQQSPLPWKETMASWPPHLVAEDLRPGHLYPARLHAAVSAKRAASPKSSCVLLPSLLRTQCFTHWCKLLLGNDLRYRYQLLGRFRKRLRLVCNGTDVSSLTYACLSLPMEHNHQETLLFPSMGQSFCLPAEVLVLRHGDLEGLCSLDVRGKKTACFDSSMSIG